MSLALSRMLLDRFFPDAGVGETRPPMDWKETRGAHVFMMDVPGLTKDEVAVDLVDGRILRVRGGKLQDRNDDDANKGGAAAGHEEKREEEGGGDGAVKWHCRERAAGGRAFETQFRLPDDAAADEVRAALADGVLTVTVPKRKGGGAGKKRHHGGGRPVCCRFWP